MKKFIALVIGTMFLFGMAATAFAIHAEIPAETQAIVAKGVAQITISGDLRIRGWLLGNNSIHAIEGQQSTGVVNLVLNGGKYLSGVYVPATGSAGYYDERVRLAVDVVDGPVSGRIHLESGNADSSVGADVFTWGNGNLNSKVGANTNSSLSILEAWINYAGTGLLGVPAGIKLGHMPLALGPATLFYDHSKFGDDAIVVYGDPTPDTHVGLLTIKYVESSKTVDNLSSDLDAYVAFVNQKVGAHTFGIYYVYLNEPDPGIDDAAFQNLSLQDLGLHATGEISGFTYMGELDLNFGKFSLPALGAMGIKAEGYAGEVKVGYKVDPVGLRAMFGIGSGQSPTASGSSDKAFIGFMGDNRYYTVVYDYTLESASGMGIRQNLANTTVFNIGADYSPVKDVSLSLDGYALRATDALVSTNPSGGSPSKNIGEEIDLTGYWNITHNLKYFVWTGYLATGSFYKDNDLSSVKKDVYTLMHGLEFAF